MEDLRESNNVRKKNRIGLITWIRLNLKNLTNLAVLSLIMFVICFPSLVCKYIGLWFNGIYSSITENVTLNHYQWGVILVSVLVFVIARWIYNKGNIN